MEGEIIIKDAGVKILFSCGRLILITARIIWEIRPIFVMSFVAASKVDFVC